MNARRISGKATGRNGGSGAHTHAPYPSNIQIWVSFQKRNHENFQKLPALQEIACAVARRNCMIFLANASPMAGGDAPRASDGLECDAEASRLVRGMDGLDE